MASSVSVEVDEATARAIEAIQQVDGVTESEILVAALDLYLRLPHGAHRALHVVAEMGDEQDVERMIREIKRIVHDVAKRQRG